MFTSLLVVTASLHGLLIGALVILIALAILIGLIYVIETYILKAPFPGLVRLILALVVLVLIVIWVAGQLGVGL